MHIVNHRIPGIIRLLNPRAKLGSPVEITGGGSDFRKVDYPRIVDNRYMVAGR
jgi:hypothetical protein